MDQEMMQLKHELKEFIEHGQHILQKMEGSMGQRYYGMRGGSGYGGGNYSGGSQGGQGGNFGNREHWMQGGYPQQEQWPNVDPRWFM
jgi:hypothetical protein